MFRVLFGLTPTRIRLVHTTMARCSQSSVPEDLDVMRARLLYQSKKRGILENDILLGDFAEEHLQKMNLSLLNEYHDMINGIYMEWDLFYYLSGKKSPPTELASSSAFKMVKEFVDKKKKQDTS